MTNRTFETSRQLYARIAGFTFLLYMVAGVTVMFLMNRATNAEGTAATLAVIARHTLDVRIAILLELIEAFSAIVLSVALFVVTREVNRELAMLALICRVCEGLTGAIGLRNTLGLLWLGNMGAGTGGPLTPTTDALGAFLLMPIQSLLIGGLFFAVGSMIFLYLFLRGRIIPVPFAWFGVVASLLLVAGLPLQLVGFFYGPMTGYLWLPMIVFQIPFGLWLLIKGVPKMTQRQPE